MNEVLNYEIHFQAEYFTLLEIDRHLLSFSKEKNIFSKIYDHQYWIGLSDGTSAEWSVNLPKGVFYFKNKKDYLYAKLKYEKYVVHSDSIYVKIYHE